MANSIESTWVSLVETLKKPIKEGTMLDMIQQSLESLRIAISESKIGETLRRLIEDSTTFLTLHGAELIDTISGLASTLITLLPSIQRFAEITSKLVGFLSEIPAPIMAIVGTFIMMRRFLPIASLTAFTLSLRTAQIEATRLRIETMALMGPGMIGVQKFAVKTASTLTVLRTQFLSTGAAAQMAANVGIFAIVSGMMAIVSGTGMWSKALGVLAIAFALLAAKMYFAAGAMSVLTFGMAAVAGASAMLAMYVAMREQISDIETPELPSGMGGTPTAYASGGLVKETGAALIHKGEYVLPKNEIFRIPSYQVGGFVSKTGMAFLHKDEYVVPTSKVANITPSSIGGNTEINSYNYDYRTITIYDPNKQDILRALREAGVNG
jgi:hypothetical protein